MNSEYTMIKQRLEECNSIDDYKNAYKWLAQKYVELNEEAIRFENKVEAKIGTKELDILICGSEEAYQRDVSFRENMSKAASKEEGNKIFLDYLKNFEHIDILEYPNLWEKSEVEEELELE